MLGVWQLQRADWKRDLISQFEHRFESAPVSWREGVCPFLDGEGLTGAPPIEMRAVGAAVEANAAGDEPLRLFGRSVSGQVGWRLFKPVISDCRPDAEAVLVQVGFEAEEVGPVPPAPEPTELRYYTTNWPERGWMVGGNEPETNEWYWLDPEEVAARASQVELNRAVVVVPVAGMPDFLVRTPPVRHISYAITWFGLAVCLLIVYALAHAKAGRLSLNGQGKTPKP